MAYNYGNYYGNMNSNGVMNGYSQTPQYNYGTYQPQPQQMSYQQSQQPQGQSIVWVQGEAGAKAYPVAPGQSVLLIPMESYDLVKRESVVNVPQISQRNNTAQSQQNVDTSEFVKMSDLEGKVNEMVSRAVSKALGE